ncbi:hypothetical protein Tco_0105389 [Tanacetum coccineum]
MSPIIDQQIRSVYQIRKRINITSKSVKNFLFSGYVDPEDPEGYISDLEDVLEINVPHILSLTIQHKCVSFSQSSLKLLLIILGLRQFISLSNLGPVIFSLWLSYAVVNLFDASSYVLIIVGDMA